MKSAYAGPENHAGPPRLPPLQKVVTWRVVDLPAQTERGQDLFAVDWRELFHRLEFYNDAAFHDRPCHVIEKKRVLTRRRGGRGGVFRCRVHK